MATVIGGRLGWQRRVDLNSQVRAETVSWTSLVSLTVGEGGLYGPTGNEYVRES